MMKSDMASQPVLTSYKLLEIERQPLIKDFDLWIKPCRHERAHGQHGAHMRAPSPDGAPAPQGPTVAIERRVAGKMMFIPSTA